MGLFGPLTERGRGQKGPLSLKSVKHIQKLWNLAQLYLTQRRFKKYMNYLPHSISFADISIFSPEISKFYYIKKYRYRFFKSLKIALIKMVTILIMSAKMATLGPMTLWFHNLCPWHHQKTSHDPNYFPDTVIWRTFC